MMSRNINEADKWMVMTFQRSQMILDLYQLLEQEASSWVDAHFGLCTMSGHLWILQALLGCLVPWGNLASLGWVPSKSYYRPYRHPPIPIFDGDLDHKPVEANIRNFKDKQEVDQMAWDCFDYHRGFPGGSDCNAGDWVLTPGSGRSPRERNNNPFQYSCLENSMDRGAWKAMQSMGSQRLGHDWVTNTCVLFTWPAAFIPFHVIYQ